MVLRAPPSGLDRVHGFRLLCRLFAVGLVEHENRESTEVFRVDSSARVDILLVSFEECDVSNSLDDGKWTLVRAWSELRPRRGGVRSTTVVFEARAGCLSRSLLRISLGDMPLTWGVEGKIRSLFTAAILPWQGSGVVSLGVHLATVGS